MSDTSSSKQVIEPSTFDLVVLGTGFTEAVVAAAAARAGKSVLQLDPASSYGGAWTSVPADSYVSSIEFLESLKTDGDSYAASQNSTACHSFELRPANHEGLGPSSSYVLDLTPKVLYGGGPLIDLLLGSGAHQYTEFKLIQGSYMLRDGRLWPVPSSRSEVFKDRGLGLPQKRALMKFLKSCSEALQEEQRLQEPFDDRPFHELMQAAGLDAQLQALLLHAVLMLDHAQHAGQAAAGAQATPGPVLHSVHSGAQAEEPSMQGSLPQHSSKATPMDCNAGGDAAAHAMAAASISPLFEGDRAKEAVAGTDAAPTAPADRTETCLEEEGPISAAAALRLLGVHMRSLGRYGQDAGPFLTPMYGGGELPQAFCRSAAVKGAVQVLRCKLVGPIFDEHAFSCTGVQLGSGQVIGCQHLAAGQEFLQGWLDTFKPPTRTAITHHCMAILSEPLVPGEGQSLLVVPPGVLPPAVHARHAVRGLALSSSTRVCPEGRGVLYLWTPADGSAASALDTLMPVLDSLVDTSGLAAQRCAAADAADLPPATTPAPLQPGGEQPQGEAGVQQQQQREEEKGVNPGRLGAASLQTRESGAAGQRAAVPLGAHDAAAGAAEGSTEGVDLPQKAAQRGVPSAGADPAVSKEQGPAVPRVLQAVFHSQQQVKVAGYGSVPWPGNTVLCPGPDHSATYLSAVQDARDCFSRLYPEISTFPFDKTPGEDEAGPGSDDEDLQALAAALGSVANDSAAPGSETG